MMEDAQILLPGPRCVERRLLAELSALCEAARKDPHLLADPVRVVVPSRSLREHVSARLVEEQGAAAGIQIQTLHALALEVLARAGSPGPAGDVLFPVLVRRVASQESALHKTLESLDDGYGSVVGAVADLLDAGLEIHLAEPLDDALAAAEEAGAPKRVRAIGRVAVRVLEELEARGLQHRSGLFRSARELLEQRPQLLPTRACWIHGYADVTGVQLDLLQVLVRSFGARVLVDQPPDPAEPGASAPGAGFTARLRSALGFPEVPVLSVADPAPPVSLRRLRRAPGAQAEVRAAAEEIFQMLEAGARPEGIAVVARELQPHRAALATQFRRLGVPFSGGPGFVSREGRRALALQDLLEQEARCPADRWLDAAHSRGGADLRLALHGIGVGRLGDVAEMDLPLLLGSQDAYVLPLRRGLAAVPGDSEEAPAEDGAEAAGEVERESQGARSRRRVVSRQVLEEAKRDAGVVLQALVALRESREPTRQFALLHGLCSEGLGWCDATPGASAVRGLLDALADEVAGEPELSRHELGLLVRRALDAVGVAPLGGAGGGVQVLSATEARGRTCDALFAIGLQRDAFPRIISDDPLLPDDVRRAIAPVLTEIPIKQRGYDEERYLFAQLCDAAPRVTLSWAAVSDDGKEQAPSPLLDRLCQEAGPRLETLPQLLEDRDGTTAEVPRPGLEHAMRVGLAAPGRLEGTLREVLAPKLAAEAGALARARVAVLAEYAGRGAARQRPGPYLGSVGPLQSTDPRASKLFVTRLEALAWCPWKAFLERVLGARPVPDALAALPDATPLLLGNVLHATLQEIVERSLGRDQGASLDELRRAEPRSVPWPDPETLTACLREAARQVARDEGIVLPGFAALLARRARPLVDRVGELDWPGGRSRVPVLGAEVQGALELPGSEGTLWFRADRLDQSPEGLVLTDYKSGKPISDAVRAATREQRLESGIRSGRRLQVAVYAAAPGAAAGRYLFAKPDVEVALAEVTVAAKDPVLREALDQALGSLLGAWEKGAFPPRLFSNTGAEGVPCRSCELSAACVKGDSGLQRRLQRWFEEPPSARPADNGGEGDDGDDELGAAARELMAMWRDR
jgi:hypothetical protein